MLDAERSVVVTGEEHYQDVLYDVLYGSTTERGQVRRVAVELVPIGPRLEARLGGQRVGELTALMSLRYGPTVDSVLRRGERPGCVGRISLGRRGVEMELRLPAVNAAGGPPTEQLPIITQARKPVRRSRTPLWLGVGVVGLLVAVGVAVGAARTSTPVRDTVAARTPAAPSSATAIPTSRAVPTTTPRPTPTTTRKPTVYYKSCEAALAAGAAPIEKGEPGYRSGLDPDGDGVACPVN
ncbi:MAG: excalibur calcium-binding domain-containing protein [Pseudonocardia sp.]|nr:excalibur calcium-binding domain-containing protein [Pseudonocardia sp.]